MSHRKQVKHFHEPGHLHEFTFSCSQRQPLLSRPGRMELLARCLDRANMECHVQLVAFVFMPEHVHLLTYFQDEQPNFGLYLARIKQPFSKQVRAELEKNEPDQLKQFLVQERPGKTCFRFWQAGPGFDRNIFSREAVEASVNYIHANPVKRGLCERATDWNWSSARYYEANPLLQQHDDLPFIHGFPEGALD